MVPAINRAIANKAEAITRSMFNTVFRDIAAAIVCSSANFAGDCTAGTYSAIAGGAICPNDCMVGCAGPPWPVEQCHHPVLFDRSTLLCLTSDVTQPETVNLREVVMIHGEWRGAATIHDPEKPGTLHVAKRPCQKAVGSDEASRQIEVLNVMTFLIEESFVAMDIDLDLVGGQERKPVMRERACGQQKCPDLIQADKGRVGVSRAGQAGISCP
jgi:hypothetical protein